MKKCFKWKENEMNEEIVNSIVFEIDTDKQFFIKK